MKASFTPLSIAAVTLLCAGCAGGPQQVALREPGLLDRLTPYKVEIPQGNVVTREQVELVKPGMPREQVRDILGSPMLTDLFHADRWDFMFSLNRSGKALQRFAVTVHFKGDVVDKVEAPNLPTEHQFVATMAAGRPQPPNVPPLELTAEQRAKLPAPVRVESPNAPTPQGAQRPYPPLEKP